MTGKCKLCTELSHSHPIVTTKCAFTTGVFSADNSNCITVSKIRQIADRIERSAIPYVTTTMSPSEQRYGTILLDHLNYFSVLDEYQETKEEPQPVCLWVGWYKHRSRTEGMWLMFENVPPRPPTEEECLAIIDAYKQYLEKD